MTRLRESIYPGLAGACIHGLTPRRPSPHEGVVVWRYRRGQKAWRILSWVRAEWLKGVCHRHSSVKIGRTSHPHV
jgi:hypothetical protein